MTSIKSKKGFTIIEVVIVLAIAGLIFAVVFWAVPNLQKSNHDNTRRNLAASIMSSLESYAGNHGGDYPAETSASFRDGFLRSFFTEFEDPLGTDFLTATVGDACSATNIVCFGNIVTSGAFAANLSYQTTVKCDSNAPGTVIPGAGSRAVAVQIRLQQGGAYCLDNSD